MLIVDFLYYPYQCSCNIYNALLSYHERFQHFCIKEDDNDDLKVKKKVLLFYLEGITLILIYLTCFNPNAPRLRYIGYICITLLQLLLVRTKKFNLSIACFMVYAFLAVYMSSRRDEEMPKVVAVVMTSHNLLFLMADNTHLYLAIMFGLGAYIQKRFDGLFACIEEGNIAKIEYAMIDFYHVWPIAYLANQLYYWNLIKTYQYVVNEKKEVHNDLVKSNKRLNKKLAEALDLLEKTNVESKEASQARELFLASVSHELRNPINAMVGNIELLLLETINPKWQQMLDTCKMCGVVLLGLVNNVLDVAKINANKLELNYLPDNFHAVLERVWAVSAMNISQKELKGTLHISKDVPKYLEIDSHRIARILLNLLDNSCKFTSQGFIKVVVSWHNAVKDIERLTEPHQDYLNLLSKNQGPEYEGCDIPGELDIERYISSQHLNTQGEEMSTSEKYRREEIHVRQFAPKIFYDLSSQKFFTLSLAENKVQIPVHPRHLINKKTEGLIKIEIIDSGCGISQASLLSLFRPFSQGDSFITRQFEGTGLGLYINQEIINKMQGHIHVNSTEGIGTNFCIILPATTVTGQEVKERLNNNTKVMS